MTRYSVPRVALTALLVMFVGFCLYALMGGKTVFAHQAQPTAAQPEGWAYGIECCSSKDCTRLPHGEISTVEGGYLVNSTGELIPYKSSKIKRSRDEFFHRCALGGDFSRKTSLCLYVPDMGF